MKHLSSSKKILAVLGAGWLVAVASGTAFAMQAREAHESRAVVEVQHTVEERHGQMPAPVFTSPLPTPKPADAHENDNRNENENHTGHVNPNDGHHTENENHAGNVHSNDNTNDDRGGSVNSNDGNHKNDHGGNNSNDGDHSDDHGSTSDGHHG